MIVLLDVRQPQERTIPRLELVELLAHRVVWRPTRIELRLTAKPIEPRRLSHRLPPAIGHEVPRDPEDITAQLFVVQRPDVGAQQTAEGILHDVVGIARVTNHAVDIRPQRARRALVEPRELDLGQRST